MKLVFHLGHPAHFQLFKNVILQMQAKGHTCYILIKKKDILEDLLKESGLAYVNIMPESKKKSKLGFIWSMLKRDWRMFAFCVAHKPDLLVGTSIEIAHAGTLLGIPSINVEEDDAAVIPLHANFGYRFSSVVFTPRVCNNGKWAKKAVTYEGYHELAYLHPHVFTADKAKVRAYFDPDEPYFLMRFVALTAHHDAGIKGINTEIATKLIQLLQPHGKIYITSERPLEPEFEPYRLKINPLDIHHVMAFSKMLIGDSQTMAAEAGVLGVPYVRFNDFVGRIGYLEELEQVYQLGTGVKPTDREKLYAVVTDYLTDDHLPEKQAQRLQKMLSEKVDLTALMIWYLENYPQSSRVLREQKDFQYQFQ